jgi:phosphoglycerate dehydrogenase-like enzyme
MSKPLTIMSGLGDVQNRRLAEHPSRPTVIPAGGRLLWDVPAEADVLMTFMRIWSKAPKEAPAGWPGKLRWIQVGSAGVDVFPDWFFEVPLITCGRGIQAPPMAEYVMAAVFAHEKRLWDVRATSPAAWRETKLHDVAGKTIGIAGFGAIGSEVASKAAANGLKVKAIARSAPLPAGVEAVAGIDELIAGCDHLVLALPSTPQTRQIICRRTLALARAGLHIINVARGALIDDAALIEALDAGRIAAATLDVTDPEPLPEGHPFYSHPLIRLTPHISGQSEGFEDRLSAKVIGNLDRFLAGQPLTDVVDRQRGY